MKNRRKNRRKIATTCVGQATCQEPGCDDGYCTTPNSDSLRGMLEYAIQHTHRTGHKMLVAAAVRIEPYEPEMAE